MPLIFAASPPDYLILLMVFLLFAPLIADICRCRRCRLLIAALAFFFRCYCRFHFRLRCLAIFILFIFVTLFTPYCCWILMPIFSPLISPHSADAAAAISGTRHTLFDDARCCHYFTLFDAMLMLSAAPRRLLTLLLLLPLLLPLRCFLCRFRRRLLFRHFS